MTTSKAVTVIKANADWASSLINRKTITIACPDFPGGPVTFTLKEPTELDRLSAIKNAPITGDPGESIEWLAIILRTIIVDPDTKDLILDEETSLKIALSGKGVDPLVRAIEGIIGQDVTKKKPSRKPS